MKNESKPVAYIEPIKVPPDQLVECGDCGAKVFILAARIMPGRFVCLGCFSPEKLLAEVAQLHAVPTAMVGELGGNRNG
jgi:hypothetical protein